MFSQIQLWASINHSPPQLASTLLKRLRFFDVPMKSRYCGWSICPCPHSRAFNPIPWNWLEQFTVYREMYRHSFADWKRTVKNMVPDMGKDNGENEHITLSKLSITEQNASLQIARNGWVWMIKCNSMGLDRVQGRKSIHVDRLSNQMRSKSGIP